MSVCVNYVFLMLEFPLCGGYFGARIRFTVFVNLREDWEDTLRPLSWSLSKAIFNRPAAIGSEGFSPNTKFVAITYCSSQRKQFWLKEAEKNFRLSSMAQKRSFLISLESRFRASSNVEVFMQTTENNRYILPSNLATSSASEAKRASLLRFSNDYRKKKGKWQVIHLFSDTRRCESHKGYSDSNKSLPSFSLGSRSLWEPSLSKSRAPETKLNEFTNYNNSGIETPTL